MGTGPDPQAIAPDDRADIIEWIVDGLDNRGYEADVSAAGDVFTVTVALNETGPTLEGQGRSRKLNGVTQSPSSVSPAAAPSPAGEPADYGWPDGVRSDVHGILQGGDGSDEAHDYATDKADEILRYFARTDLASPAGEAEPRECSGIAATWCDVHGECTCPSFGPDDPERTMDGYTCPLHSFTSEHPIEPAAAVSPVPGEPDETRAPDGVTPRQAVEHIDRGGTMEAWYIDGGGEWREHLTRKSYADMEYPDVVRPHWRRGPIAPKDGLPVSVVVCGDPELHPDGCRCASQAVAPVEGDQP